MSTYHSNTQRLSQFDIRALQPWDLALAAGKPRHILCLVHATTRDHFEVIQLNPFRGGLELNWD